MSEQKPAGEQPSRPFPETAHSDLKEWTGATPQVTVLMPVYNGTSYLDEAVTSILAQEGLDFEFLLVDDGSVDCSVKVMRRYEREDSRIRILEQPHKGISCALNLGLTNSRAPLIAIAEQDDRSCKKRLRVQLAFMDENPDVVVVSSWAHYIGVKGLRRGLALAGPTSQEEFDRLNNNGPIHIVSPTAMFRKDPVLSLGGFDSRFDGCQDEHLWNQLARQGRVHTIPLPLIDYRLHPSSASFVSHLNQVAFRYSWRDANSGANVEPPHEYLAGLRQHDRLLLWRIGLKARGYAHLRRAAAYMADHQSLKAFPHLSLGSLLNPGITIAQLRRRVRK